MSWFFKIKYGKIFVNDMRTSYAKGVSLEKKKKNMYIQFSLKPPFNVLVVVLYTQPYRHSSEIAVTNEGIWAY